MSQSTPGSGFQQRLGLFDASMLVAGTMIGSGIFIVSVGISRDTGGSGWLLAVWAVAGVMTVLGALAYAELAAMMPHAGGQYVFLRESYGGLWGFLFGWTSFTVIQTGTIAAVAVAFAKFAGVFIPALAARNTDIPINADIAVLWGVSFDERVILLPLPWLEPLTVFKRKEFTVTYGQLVAVLLLLGLTAWNTLGVRQGKWVQNILTVAKIGTLATLIVVGLTVTYNSEAVRFNLQHVWSDIHDTKQTTELRGLIPGAGVLLPLMVMGGALVGALFSADAWGNVTFTAGEIRNPKRNLPLSMVLGTGLVIALYLLANVAYLASLPVIGEKGALTPIARGISEASDKRVGTAILEIASPNSGTKLMAAAIMISTLGCVNGLILMGARLYYAMAKDRLFFSQVGSLNRNGVPAVGLWLQAIWACLLLFSGTYDDLLDYVIFAQLLFYGLTVGGLFVLRFKRPDAERPYRAFGYPVLPVLYIGLCLVVMLDLLIVKPIFTWPGLLLVLAGIPVYLLWRWLGK